MIDIIEPSIIAETRCQFVGLHIPPTCDKELREVVIKRGIRKD
jgi:hypothetical protein